MGRRITLWFGLSIAAAGCEATVQPLPTEITVQEANRKIERADQPPLYQLLYDYAFLPEVQYSEQRVRILIWLEEMDFSDFQLRSLLELHRKAERERHRIEEAQRQIIKDYEPRLKPIYDALWEALQADPPPDDEALEATAGALLTERLQHSREKELLQLRTQGVRSVLGMSRDWLATLDPHQEALLTDSLFFLRHRLDPYANHGDFRALIGTLFVAGDYGTLTRGSYDPDADHLNLGALWTEQSLSERQGPRFNEARRSLIIYMILMEPALPEAIRAALGPDAQPPSGAPGDGTQPPMPGAPPP